MAVQDYELLLRVRADMIQAINGLDNVRKKLDDTGKEAKDMGDKAGKAVDGMSEKFGKLKTLIGGLAIAAGIRAVFGAVQESEDAVAQLDARLKSTGGAAGLTRDQLIDLSGQMQKLTTYGDEAVLSMETLLLSFGNIKKGQFEGAVTAVLDVATAKGMDLASAATQIGKALNDPIKGMAGLQKIGISFTDAQKDVIQSLVDTGQAAAAQQLILDQLKVSFGGTAEAAANTLGGALQQLKEAAGDLMEGDGGNLNDTTASVKELTRTLQDPAVKDGFAAMVDGLVSVASFAAKAAGAFAGFGSAVADFFRDNENKSYMGLLQQRMRLDDKRADLQSNPIAGRLGWNKGDIAELDRQIAEIDKLILLRNEAAKPKAAAGTGSGTPPAVIDTLPTVTVHASAQESADKSAAEKAAAQTAKFVAAGDALQKQLTDLQGSLDPAASAWNAYNAAVDRANASAELAKQAKGANVESIEAQRKATIGLAATIRDAAIDKLSAVDREAWEKLRDSLRTPVEVKMDTATAQIKQLNDLLAKGTITADQYHAAVARVGTGSVTALPQYQGVDASVAGPAGELAKNFDASAKLDAAYQEQLASADAFRAKDAAHEEAYQAQKAELDRQYAEERNKIEQGRQQLTLSAAGDFFGQLANLQHSSNNKIARIGKAAAIAQAMINTYQSATAAFSAMASIPYVGPALGAAAAAVAVATGLANVAQIRAQPDSYDTGGYTGPGGRLELAGIVHRGEGVLNQQEIAALGGPSGFYALRHAIARGYADGGFVDAAGAKTTVAPDFDAIAARSAPRAAEPINQRIVVGLDTGVLEDWATSSSFERAVKVTIGRNPSFIRQAVR